MGATVMAKQLHAALGADNEIPKVTSSAKPVIEGGVKTKLLRIIARLSRYVRKQDRRQLEEIYIPRKSREEESRLEFQRFLYW
jgi:hypothetical protein